MEADTELAAEVEADALTIGELCFHDTRIHSASYRASRIASSSSTYMHGFDGEKRDRHRTKELPTIANIFQETGLTNKRRKHMYHVFAILRSRLISITVISIGTGKRS